MNKQRNLIRTRSLGVLLAVFVVLAPACSESEPSTCEAAQSLDDSIHQLLSLDTLEGGKEGIQDAMKDVRSDLEDLHSAASDQYGPALQDLKAQLKDLNTAVQSANLSNLDEVKTQAEEVKTSFDSLTKELSSGLADCKLSSS